METYRKHIGDCPYIQDIYPKDLPRKIRTLPQVNDIFSLIIDCMQCTDQDLNPLHRFFS